MINSQTDGGIANQRKFGSFWEKNKRLEISLSGKKDVALKQDNDRFHQVQNRLKQPQTNHWFGLAIRENKKLRLSYVYYLQ